MSEKHAPGAPGLKPKWTSSSKSGIGKALDGASSVLFTTSHGILNEVYFPREDIACIRDMEFMVADGKDFFSEEKRDTNHLIKMIKAGVPCYQIINTCIDKKYEIQKEIIADPLRNTVLQNVSFKQKKASRNELHLYTIIAPHLIDQGADNSGWLGEYKGVEMLFAQHEDFTLAVACSSNWLKRSVGFVGTSDGYTDLEKHKKMQWQYQKADNGNIALTGEIDVSTSGDFLLALSFGRNIEEAANHARGSLLEGFESSKTNYIKGWENWQKSLRNIKEKSFKISAAVLRMHEAKNFPGGIIASLSIPWGETKGDDDKGGYHVVWPRDLAESAGGFMALKQKDDSLRIINYLMSTQKADGSWAQNMWLEGTPHWKGLQMDQTALPIVLINKCCIDNMIDKPRMKRYWPLVKKAIAFLINHGPYTQQDRWEEEKGFSAFTLATEIAGLLAGGDIAERNDEHDLAKFCRETADYWNDNIEKWTYVTGTNLAKKHDVEGYYIRINPYHHIPASELGDKKIDLKNHTNGNGKTLINELISVDALALVRFGLRAPDDEKILNTIKVIDAVLKVDTPNGPSWHRYNNDGYGEHENGDAYDGTGIGRAWPLLTGERGHYEVAAGNIAEAKKLLKSMEKFSNHGLLPEQIWDTEDIPEKELFFGEHTGSGMPLTWAHAEYIKLWASIRDKKVFDMPEQAVDRYINKKIVSPFMVWNFTNQFSKLPSSKTLRIEIMADAKICWTTDEWKTTNETKTKDIGIGIFIADLKTKAQAGSKIEFTFFWNEADKWENENYNVEIYES